MNISILLPTRKRLNLLKKSVQSLIDNARHPDKLQFLFGVDEDDNKSLKVANNLLGSNEGKSQTKTKINNKTI